MQAEERHFFKKIQQAITSNPFSRDRLSVDLELTGLVATSPTDEILKGLVDKVGKIITRFLERTKGNLSSLATEERQLLEFGMLFQVFHLYCDKYDNLIREQVDAGETSCQITFAKEFLTLLEGYGFSNSDSLRYFSLFFQMRRAYFFISRISGESQCVRNLRKRLWNNIFTYDIELYDKYLWNRLEDFSTMLLGETGTGKGLAASAIGCSGFIPFDEKRGRFSESFARTFRSINLSQFPEQLIESELFGHNKGAFTGAVDSHKGVFARCSPHGAIFLDEIGDVSVPVQVKLLQVLQERNFTPVGSRSSERFHGRVIAATNKSLDKLRDQGEMRDDFYYRLCSDVIEVPSLRQRVRENPNEIYVLLNFIIKKIIGKPSEELAEQVGAHIIKNQPEDYLWSGNIRELEQCVRRILISNSYHWQKSASDESKSSLELSFKNGELTAQQLLSSYCRKLYHQLGTYEAVAQRTELDRRTVKKHIQHSE